MTVPEIFFILHQLIDVSTHHVKQIVTELRIPIVIALANHVNLIKVYAPDTTVQKIVNACHNHALMVNVRQETIATQVHR